ncbi:nuclear transport factor 2 family protein [Pedobacter rhizosphaerae]|uniref:Putative lumazine-binding n=1 Tax=Pedobacter rhizosphaerae TaxID=390241 RepID=A0A1H9V3I5_9SPHI|nr:nuclear transport factor 2 family protein [Pedobacter rhizosphaerae]SES15863.1 Putative lumazine-binding [Pedobacter rhizosphaerae]
MKKLLLFALFFIGITLKVVAQTNEEDAIKKTINNLFTGMKRGDSTIARLAFADHCILQTISTKTGKAVVKTESVAEFIKFIGTPHKEKFDERIVFTKILIDGPLAVVWTDYKFYLDDKFSHCGVNSFQLVKGEAGWKIVYLIDTRRKDGCGKG